MSAVNPHPRAVELVERGKLRRKVKRAVSRLIAILDELDTDPEAEPLLGASEASPIVPQWPRSSADDREEEEDAEEPLGWPANISHRQLGDNKADGEPSLASPEHHHDQRRQAAGGQDDREEDEHGAEIDHGELDYAEHGIADQDGLAEQRDGFLAGMGGMGGSGYVE